MPDENTVSVEAGSTLVNGHLTQFVGFPGDTFNAAGLSVPVATVDSTSQLTLEYPWPGPDLVDSASWSLQRSSAEWSSAVQIHKSVAALVQRFEGGIPMTPANATGNAGGRTLYDDAPEGFVYAEASAAPGSTIYVSMKLSDSTGDWSAKQPMKPDPAQSTVESEAARDRAVEAESNTAADRIAVDASAILAQKWATQTAAEVVAGQGFGAKYYADIAIASSDSLLAYGAATPGDPSAAAANVATFNAAKAAVSGGGLGAVTLPTDDWYVDLPPLSLPPLRGSGRVVDSNDNMRGRFFTAVTGAVAIKGDQGSVETAFNGDFSRCQFPIEHRIMGDASLGAPPPSHIGFDVLRSYVPEAYPSYTYLHAEAGAKTGQFFATAASGDHKDVFADSLGDVFARTSRIAVNRVKPGFLSTIDNGWGGGELVDLFATRSGVQLLGHEMNGCDNGHDVGYVGYNSWAKRTNATGANYAHWIHYIAKASGGYLASDVGYTAYGKFKIGLNLAEAEFSEPGYEGAAITMAAGQYIYLNATAGSVPDDYRWIPGNIGVAGVGYDAGNTLLFNNSAGFVISTSGVQQTGGLLGFRGSTPVAKATITGSRGSSDTPYAQLFAALHALGLITNSTTA